MHKIFETIIEEWKSNESVIGILLTGSFAIGTYTESSDIDIRIVFDNSMNTTIKGVKRIKGYKVSYFGESVNGIKKRISHDYFRNLKFEARVFSIGKILYKQDEQIDEIVNLAKEYMVQAFKDIKKDNDTVLLRLYSLNVEYHYLSNISGDSALFLYNYMLFMRSAMNFYSWYLNYEHFIDIKTDSVLNNNEYPD
jgi:predicted nucleotidyltransferase